METLLMQIKLHDYLTIFGIGGIALAILAWIRFKSKDKADVHKTDAEAAEILIKAATELARRANEQCEATSRELEATRQDLAEAELIVEKMKAMVSEHQDKLRMREEEHRNCMVQVRDLQRQLDELTGPDRRNRHNNPNR